MCFQFHPFEISEEEVEVAEQAALEVEDFSGEENYNDDSESLMTRINQMATSGFNGLNRFLGLMGEKEVLVEHWIQLSPDEKVEVFDTILDLARNLELDLVKEAEIDVNSEQTRKAMEHIRYMVMGNGDERLESA